MKKLAMVALVAATSAFAWTDGKSMVELNGCLDNGRCDTLDFRMYNDDAENTAGDDVSQEDLSFALNYNWLFTNNFGAGLKYVSSSSTIDGDMLDSVIDDNFQTIGVNLFWNFAGGWESAYAALRYDMTTGEESDTTNSVEGIDARNTITLEYGKRMQMGKVFGLALLYSPSVSYAMRTTEYNDSDEEDLAQNELRLNVANFAVSF